MLDTLGYRLHYVQATIAEISRINTTAPLAGPHKALKDTELGGYTVKKVIYFPTIILIIYILCTEIASYGIINTAFWTMCNNL
jgi:hypothetical protein